VHEAGDVGGLDQTVTGLAYWLTQDHSLSASAHNSTDKCNDCNVKIVKSKVKVERPKNRLWWGYCSAMAGTLLVSRNWWQS